MEVTRTETSKSKSYNISTLKQVTQDILQGKWSLVTNTPTNTFFSVFRICPNSNGGSKFTPIIKKVLGKAIKLAY